MRCTFLIILLITTLFCSAQQIERTQLLADIKTLSSEKFEGRRTGTKGNRLAADYISERFKKLGLGFYTDNYIHPFQIPVGKASVKAANNVIAYIKGRTDKQIVISAHYDHLGINGKQLFYGADDNASGIAALLAVAEYFKQHPPINTIIFAAFDAEELGLKGSYAFLRDPLFNKKNISLNVNMDMLAHNDRSELYASGTFKYPEIKRIISDEDKNTAIRLLFGHDKPGSGKDDWTMQSDQGAFSAVNIPYIYFGVEDHKDYHQVTDTFENINPDFFYNASTVVLKSIIRLDKELHNIIKKPVSL